MTADDDAPSAEGGDLINPGDLEKLRARISRIQESGGTLQTPSQKLFELATAKPPSIMLRDFFATASPMVQQGMQDAVVSLLGALPPFEFDSQLTTTGDKLAALMLQLQMTGYMLRNAEYVMTLRKVLQLKSRSSAEYRKAFDRIDLDGSGFIEIAEVESLLGQVYTDDDGVPDYEVRAMLELFDTDGDGRISWEEFAAALGAVDAAEEVSSANLLLLEASEEAVPAPTVGGNVTVTLDDGTEVEMDTIAYMSQLQDEARALRAELAKKQSTREAKETAMAASLSAYVSSLPEAQLKLLSSNISEDVVTAMRQIVTYILRAPSGDGPLDKDAEVTMEQQKLQQLCLYQLVLGYTMREAEATGAATEALGR